MGRYGYGGMPFDNEGFQPMPRAGKTPCEECAEPGIAFNDEGDWLCEECLAEWALEEGYTSVEIFGSE